MSIPIFKFKTNDLVYGVLFQLIDENHHNNINVDIFIGNKYYKTYDVLHKYDIDEDHLGRSSSFYKILFEPFKTSETIILKVKTQLLYNNITSKLIKTNVNINHNIIHSV